VVGSTNLQEPARKYCPWLPKKLKESLSFRGGRMSTVTLSRYFLMSFLKLEIVVVIIFAKFSTILSTTSQKQVYRLSYSKYSILSLRKEYVIYLVV
jgi:hypothetical protein